MRVERSGFSGARICQRERNMTDNAAWEGSYVLQHKRDGAGVMKTPLVVLE